MIATCLNIIAMERVDENIFLNYPYQASLSIDPCVRKNHKVDTHFLVKHDNNTFFIQHDMNNVALVDFKLQRQRDARFPDKSFIRSCIKTQPHDLLITGHSNGMINVWPIASDELWPKDAHHGAVISLAQENDVICSAAQDGVIKVGRITADDIVCEKTFRAGCIFTQDHVKNNTHALMLKDGLLYAGSSLGNVSILDMRAKDSVVMNIYSAHNKCISCFLACKHNPSLSYSGSFDGSIKQWDLRKLQASVNHLSSYKHETSPLYATHELSSQRYGITCLYESNAGGTLISGGASGIRVWDVKNNAYHSSYAEGMDSRSSFWVDAIAVNDDETELFVAKGPQGIQVFDIKKAKTFSPRITTAIPYTALPAIICRGKDECTTLMKYLLDMSHPFSDSSWLCFGAYQYEYDNIVQRIRQNNSLLQFSIKVGDKKYSILTVAILGAKNKSLSQAKKFISQLKELGFTATDDDKKFEFSDWLDRISFAQMVLLRLAATQQEGIFAVLPYECIQIILSRMVATTEPFIL